jgi:hypothetical protein
MPFVTKTFDQMLDLAKAVIIAKQPAADVSDGSDYDMTARMLATVFMGNQSQADFLSRQILGPGSVGEWLDRHLSANGIVKPLATRSYGRAILTAGSNGLVQPALSALTSDDGTNYYVAQDAVSRTPAWTGKKVAYALSRDRLIVAPNAAGMAIGDLMLCDAAGVVMIVDIGPAFDGSTFPYVFVDISPPFPFDPGPPDNATLTPVCGAAALVSSVDPGANTQRSPGEAVTITAPVGTFVGSKFVDVTGGSDDATEADNQALLAGRLTQTALAGTEQYYRELALRTPAVNSGTTGTVLPDPGLEDVVVFPNVFGLGVITVYPISKNRDERRVGAAGIAAIIAQLESGLLLGNQIDVRNMLYEFASLQLVVLPQLGYEPDFQIADAYNANSSVPGMPINASTSVASSGIIGILMSDPGFVNSNITTLKSFIEVGDRISFAPFSGIGMRSKLYQFPVLAVNDDNLVIDPHPDLDAATVRIFAGGPLIDPVNEAVLDFFGGLGPGNAVIVPWGGGNPAPLPVANQIYRRHPDPGQRWPCIMHASRLSAVVVEVPGVDDVLLLGGMVGGAQLSLVPEVGSTVGLSRLTIVHG